MEALVALGAASNVVSFVDFASRLAAQISEYSAAAAGAPKRIQDLEARLNIVIRTLNGLSAKDILILDQEKQTISLCIDQVKELRALLDKAKLKQRPSSVASPSWGRRQRDRIEMTWKALKSLRAQDKIQELQESLERLLNLLNLQMNVNTSMALDKSKEEILQKIEQLQLSSKGSEYNTSNGSSVKQSIPILQNPNFVPRAALTDAIEQRFSTGQRTVVLCGLGGAGKTQIALEYAFRKREQSPDTSVFWVYASTTTNFEESYKRIATVCNIPGHQDPQVNILQLVRDWLEIHTDHEWLMVIDNVDIADTLFHERVNGRTLTEYIPQTQRGSLLYTSRNRDVAVDILHGGDPIHVGPMSPNEAHKLLSTVEPLESEEADISSLLRELEYIPLAITQAAAFMSKRHKSAGQYLDLFRGSDSAKAQLLAHEFVDHGREARSRESVAKTWMISFAHISEVNPRAAEMLSLMSCYDQQSIPQLLLRYDNEDGLQFDDAVGLLLAFSLIRVASTGTTYSMHRLVQIAMTTWLSMTSELAKIKYNLRALSMVTVHYPDFAALSQISPKDLFEAETILTHAERVLAYAISKPEKQDSLNRAHLSFKMGVYFNFRGRWNEAEPRLKEAYTLRSAILGPTNPLMVQTGRELGWVYYNTYDYDSCENLIHPIWENIAEEVDREEQVRDIIRILVLTLIKKKEYHLAESLIKQSISKLQDSTQMSNAWLTCHYLLGRLYRYQGNGAEAKRLYYLALHDCGLETTQLNVRDVISCIQRNEEVTLRLVVDTLGDLADLLEEEGRLEEAESMFQILVDVCEEVYGAMGIFTINSVFNLAQSQEELKKYESAGLMYQRAYTDSETLYGPSHSLTLEYKQDFEDFEARMEQRRQDSDIEADAEQNTQPTSSQASDTSTII
ncbi:hypothetical protein G7Y79_00012g033670 [Physcia stellaris]|nr:hypothetical protein G7Y79_00012g033670 [Physcia stellaris]